MEVQDPPFVEVQDPPFLWRFLVVITCLVHGYHVLVTRLQSGNNAVSWKEGVEFSAPFFFIRSERSSVKYQVKNMYTPFLGVFFWLIFPPPKRTFRGLKSYP